MPHIMWYTGQIKPGAEDETIDAPIDKGLHVKYERQIDWF
jgi:hypothetical protein